MVYLATDPDREGEAISWHLKQLLNLPDDKTRRVTFNEITKNVVQESIREPRDIDQNLVDAQQARRILDRIVGYQLSPLLWKKIRRGLSAGRVQSVATRMVDDRDREIEAFQPEEYWTLDAKLTGDDAKKLPFAARYHGKDGKKAELKSEAEVDAVVRETEGAPFTVRTVKRTDKQRSPSPPFTTSTMQQEASRKLSMTPRRTMAIAQQLYEGVDIEGEGTVGLITYMRTDSLRISEEALAAAKTFVTGRYGADYAQTHRYKAKANAQDAHEAIRPSNVNWDAGGPEKGPDRRAVPALPPGVEPLRGQPDGQRRVRQRVRGDRVRGPQLPRQLLQPEVLRLHRRVRGGEGRGEGGKGVPPNTRSSVGEALTLRGFDREQHFTQPPAHYTDATLIRAMEEQGIGRPSTYAPTVSTILDREYVVKEGKYLHITNLGRVVTALMKERFSDIADLKFTAHMEQKLDSVEEGTTAWKDVLREFYGGFEENLESAEKALDGTRIKVPDEVSEEICPECGRHLVVKSGRFGRFLACPGYPECSFTMPLVVEMPGRCPKCGGRLMKRTGRSKKDRQAVHLLLLRACQRPGGDGKVRLHDLGRAVKDDCPVCGHTMFKKAGKGFKRPFCINPDCANFLRRRNGAIPGERRRTAPRERRTPLRQRLSLGRRLPGRRRSPSKRRPPRPQRPRQPGRLPKRPLPLRRRPRPRPRQRRPRPRRLPPRRQPGRPRRPRPPLPKRRPRPRRRPP